MELQLSTPALLFSAITLLMLAFTNRFLAIATLIRGLHKNYLKDPDQEIIVEQIHNLIRRILARLQLSGPRPPGARPVAKQYLIRGEYDSIFYPGRRLYRKVHPNDHIHENSPFH